MLHKVVFLGGTSLWQVGPALLLCTSALRAAEPHGLAAGKEGLWPGTTLGPNSAHPGLGVPEGGLSAGDTSFPTRPALRLLASFKGFHFGN